jgi:hypothetical protein
MWMTVIVKANGGVHVRPDNPKESDASYHAARKGSVFEHRVNTRTADIPGQDETEPYYALESAIRALQDAKDSAPLPSVPQ